MSANAPMPNPYATEFFSHEYRLYRQMHFYSKPLILWGDGIIMGGGMGLMAGCSHRIVTERTRFAMPEVTIGLFPDASGSWFLQRMPAKTGLFLGLTGAMCNGNDALFANLAEYAVSSDDYDAIIRRLKQSNWQAATESNDTKSLHDNSAYSIVSRALAAQATADLPPSKLAAYWYPIQKLMNSGGLGDIDALLQSDEALAQLGADFFEDSWTQRAVATYRHGCPTTAALTYALYHKVTDLSIEQVLYLETNVAVHCAANPDFKEGVRALLIDKDRNPQWSRSLADCLSDEGMMTVNLFANELQRQKNITAMVAVFDVVVWLPEVHDANVVAIAFKRAPSIDFAVLYQRAAMIRVNYKLPAPYWVNGLKEWMLLDTAS